MLTLGLNEALRDTFKMFDAVGLNGTVNLETFLLVIGQTESNLDMDESPRREKVCVFFHLGEAMDIPGSRPGIAKLWGPRQTRTINQGCQARLVLECPGWLPLKHRTGLPG